VHPSCWPVVSSGRRDPHWQRQLSQLVTDVYKARTAAQRKIEEAKRLVESAIRETTGVE